MAASAFSDTLQAITSAKLSELSRKQTSFQTSRSSWFKRLESEEDPGLRVRLQIQSVEHAFSMHTGFKKLPPNGINDKSHHSALKASLRNITRFLDQARYDPSISSKLLSEWELQLKKEMFNQSNKYKYATLYGDLVKEWLKEDAVADSSWKFSEDFEMIERAEKEQARAGWEKLVFEPLETDQMAISAYLSNLFGEGDGLNNSQTNKPISTLRKSVETFEASLSTPGQFTETVLRWTINGLLGSGLLSEEKNSIMKYFLSSRIILVEIGDVLNQRIETISRWSWEEGVSVEQRKHVTGSYHVYFDEEVLQAIFLQYVGVKWAVFLKEAFTNFSNADGAWVSSRPDVSTLERQRRDYFLGYQIKKPSVQSKRQGIYKSIFFLSQLPDTVDAQGTAIQGEEEASYDAPPIKRQKISNAPMVQQQAPPQNMMMQSQSTTMQPVMMQQLRMQQLQRQQQAQQAAAQQSTITGRNPHRSSGSPNLVVFVNEEYDLEPDHSKPKSAMDTKQFLLHLVSTELLLNTQLHGEFNCIHSAFESFSPKLPHSSILAVLSFFGLSKIWQGFFHKFLSVPLNFASDSTSNSPRNRKRGVPGSHALSLVCGEAVLFCLDYAVNQAANGTPLHRIHDDFWIWSKSQESVVQAWSAITNFNSIMGLSLNEGKTGTVRILKDQSQQAPIDPILPTGEIRWGFLVMNAITGRFNIDPKMVDVHIKQLQVQLKSKSSILAWIQVWNTYLNTFFLTNFGKPSNCSGREHIDTILETMAYIQKSIFGGRGNVVNYLKAEIVQRFGVEVDVDGWFYFPASLGGLDVKNPFIKLGLLRENCGEGLGVNIERFLEREKEVYTAAHRRFVKNGYRGHSVDGYRPSSSTEFLTLEEFGRGREDWFCSTNGLLGLYEWFLEKPREDKIDLSGEEEREFDGVGIGKDDSYTTWVASMYGEEIREKFGGLKIVEKGLLPMGMVECFKNERIKWQE